MVNRDDEVFTLIHDKLREDYPDLEIANTAILSPPIFPFVYIAEIDNRTTYRMQTHTNKGDKSEVSYEIAAFDTQTGSARRKCRDILKKIDDIFRRQLCFRRDSCTSMTDPNLDVNKTVAIYTGKLNKEQTIL